MKNHWLTLRAEKLVKAKGTEPPPRQELDRLIDEYRDSNPNDMVLRTLISEAFRKIADCVLRFSGCKFKNPEATAQTCVLAAWESIPSLDPNDRAFNHFTTAVLNSLQDQWQAENPPKKVAPHKMYPGLSRDINRLAKEYHESNPNDGVIRMEMTAALYKVADVVVVLLEYWGKKFKDADDAKQSAVMLGWERLQTFDPNSGCSFFAHVAGAMNGHLRDIRAAERVDKS